MKIRLLVSTSLGLLFAGHAQANGPEYKAVHAEKRKLSTAELKNLAVSSKNRHKDFIAARAPTCPPPPPPAFIVVPTQNPNALANAFFPNPLATNSSALPPQTVGVNFVAGDVATNPTLQGTPPDSMGVAGPEQFYFAINNAMAVFDKQGNKQDFLDCENGTFLNLDGDFSLFLDNTDPRIRYDKSTDRFYYSILNFDDFQSNAISGFSLAVSDSGVISNNTTWTVVNIFDQSIIPDSIGCSGDQNLFLDFDTLGIDDNALYVGGNMFDVNDPAGPWIASSVFVIQKESLLNDGPVYITAFRDITGFTGWVTPFRDSSSTLQPATNFDENPTFGYVIAQDPTMFGKLNLYRIANAGTTTPSISAQIPLDVLTTFCAEADLTFVHPTFSQNLYGNAGVLDPLDDRLQSAHVRNKQLFACHTIIVDANGVGSAAGDRIGIRWYQIDLTGDSTGNGQGTEELNTVPALVQAGTIWDPSPNNPLSYYMATIMTNKRDDLVVSGTVSGVTQHTSAFYVGRLATDPLGVLRIGATINDRVYAVGSGAYTRSISAVNQFGQRWGDYSYVSLDPVDDMTMWTIQEIAVNGIFTNVVAQLLAPTL